MEQKVAAGAPALDPAEFRAAGRLLVDRIAELLEGVETAPLFPDVDPRSLEKLFAEPLPEEGEGLAALLADLEEKLLPYCTHVNHPGYFGLITPTPLPAGILGDFLASALNQNIGTWTIGPSAVAMERRVVRWLTDLVGWDDGAGGNLTSGGMAANLNALKLARDFASGDRAQHEGVRDGWAVYTSEERHVSVDKAADIVGLGRDAMRIIPADERFEIRLDALEAAIEEDRSRGVFPACIVAMGGSTNTGAVDSLRRLREIADREGMWLHVDAAYGGGMLISREHPGVLDGIELADSVTMDPHKWFYAPLDAGAILVRDASRLTASYGLRPPYLTDESDEAGERFQYFVHSLEQSRRFRGLKVWMSFKRYGARQIAGWIDGNVAQALRLYELAAAHPDFEPAVRPHMSAVCVRYVPGGDAAAAGAGAPGAGIAGAGGEAEAAPEARLARLHARVARRIEEGGRFWISTTVLKGRGWFRVNPVNFRTRIEHIDALFETLVEECERAWAEG